MPKSRLVLLVAAFVAASFGLLAAGAASAQETSTLAKIKASGAITFGYREASFGFSYLDGDAKPVGYSIEICKRIVEAIKTELKLPATEIKYQTVTSANRIPLGIKSIADLQGKTVVTTAGTTSFRLLREADKGRSLEFTQLAGKAHTDSFLLVESGRAQAFVLDDILLAGQIANARRPADFAIVGESLRTENQSLMFRRDDPEFKALVDRVVGGMMKSGEMEKIYHRWFMSPIPPKNININYPLNAETRDAFANPSSKGV